MACKTCKWLEVPPDKSGRIVVRAANVYRCAAPEPEQPKLPASMTVCYGWHWPPRRQYMTGKDGNECPTYEKREIL